MHVPSENEPSNKAGTAQLPTDLIDLTLPSLGGPFELLQPFNFNFEPITDALPIFDVIEPANLIPPSHFPVPAPQRPVVIDNNPNRQPTPSCHNIATNRSSEF